MPNSIPHAQSRVLQFREAKGLTQEALAVHCGLTRQAISAIEAGEYFPNSIAALRMARALECSVEELFVLDEISPLCPVKLLGELPDAPQRVNVVKVRSRTLAFPLAPHRQLLEGFASANGIFDTTSAAGRARLLVSGGELERTALMVGCDPGLAIVSSHLSRRDTSARLILRSGSSQSALNAVRSGEAHLAGTHLPESGSRGAVKGAAAALGKRGGLVVAFARWEQGLVIAARNPKGIKSIADLARRDVCMINREPGSGSRALLDHWLRRAGIPAKRVRGYNTETASHQAVAHTVLYGGADVGVGLRAVAHACGLEFVPLADVRFDFVVPKDVLKHAAVSVLMDLLQSRRLRAELSLLPGYDVTCMGDIIATIQSGK